MRRRGVTGAARAGGAWLSAVVLLSCTRGESPNFWGTPDAAADEDGAAGDVGSTIDDGGGPAPDGAPPSGDGPRADSGPPVDVSKPPVPVASGGVFDTKVLHVVEITIDSRYFGKLETDTETRVPCTFVYDGVVLPSTGIRRKGGLGSRRGLFDKTGFSVDFHELVPRQRLGTLEKLTLNNAVQDPSFLNEHLGYEIYRRAGLPAPLTAHAFLLFNGIPFGIYVVKETIDKDFLARNFGAANDRGNLYEGECCGDFVPDPGRLELKDEVREMRSRADILALVDLIQNSPDAEWAARVGARLDFDNFIGGYAVDSLVNNWDGYAHATNNFYVYDHPGTGKFLFLPHGMDQIFTGNDPLEQPVASVAVKTRLLPELNARFLAELARILGEPWDLPALEARIDAVSRALHSFQPSDPRSRLDIDSFDANVQRIRTFLTKRKAWARELATRAGGG